MGTTKSPEFPNAQGWSTGGEFLVRFSPDGATLPYSGRYPDGSAGEALALDSAGLLRLAGSSGIVHAVPGIPRPAMRAFGIANTAYGTIDARIAPGEVISIYGPHIGPVPPVAQPNTTGRVPTSLGGVQVLIDNLPAPLLYVSDSQINAVVPFGISGKTTVPVRIAFNGTTSPDLNVFVLPVSPGIFQTPEGNAAAINQDGTVNSADHPAKPGSVMSIWVTGTDLGADRPADGEIPAAAREYQHSTVLSGATPLYADYVGAAPGLVAGVTQINFHLPADFQGGYISVMSDGILSNPVFIFGSPPD